MENNQNNQDQNEQNNQVNNNSEQQEQQNLSEQERLQYLGQMYYDPQPPQEDSQEEENEQEQQTIQINQENQQIPQQQDEVHQEHLNHLYIQQQQQEQQQNQQDQQQYQQDQEQEQEEGQGIESIFQIVNSLNNEIFLHENNLNGLIQLLMLDMETPFDEISLNMKEEDLINELQGIIKHRTQHFEINVGSLLSAYEQKMQIGQIGNLEKIMTILKAKNKEIYLKKVQQNNNEQQCSCNNSLKQFQFLQQDQQQQNNDNQEEEQEQVQEQIQQHQHYNGNKQEYEDQQNGQQNKENIMQQQIYEQENQQQLQQQEEQIEDKHQRLLQENQQLHQQLNNLNMQHQQLNLDILQQQQQQVQEQEQQQHQIIQENQQEQEQQLQKFNQAQQSEEQEGEQQENRPFQMQDIFNILNMKFLDMNMLQDYDPGKQQITFKMGTNYCVQIRNGDKIQYDNSSLISNVPHSIIQNNIFPYLTAYDLFKLRGVSKEWGELVRGSWHKAFKREMFEQLMAADLCKEIEKEFKLVHLRNPFRQKLSLLLKAIVELVNYEDLSQLILDEEKISIRDKRIFITIFKMLGMIDINMENNNIISGQNINGLMQDASNENQQYQKIERLDQVQDKDWERFRHEAQTNLKQHMNKIFDSEFNFMSKRELFEAKHNFLNHYDLQIENFTGQDDKNQLLLVLFAKQCFIFALLKNYIYIIQHYIQLAKNRLDILSKEWPENKGFLEGAYKILLLRNVRIKNGQIINEEQLPDEEFDGNEQDDQTDAEQIMKNLLNLRADGEENLGEPDFLIRKRGTVTKVFLDSPTKVDIIYSSLMELQNNAIQGLATMMKKTQEMENIQQKQMSLLQGQEMLLTLKQFSRCPAKIQNLKQEKSQGLKVLLESQDNDSKNNKNSISSNNSNISNDKNQQEKKKKFKVCSIF